MEKQEAAVTATSGQKTPYETPELQVLGDVQDITKQYDVSVSVH